MAAFTSANDGLVGRARFARFGSRRVGGRRNGSTVRQRLDPAQSGPSRVWVEWPEAALRDRVALPTWLLGDVAPAAAKCATGRSTLSLVGLLWFGSELADSLF